MKVFDEFRDFFDPEVRRRKQLAAQAAAENERRSRQDALVAEVGALAASPVIQGFREALLVMSEATYPVGAMDSAGAFWYRRGLEQAVKTLDDTLATAEDSNA